MGEAEAAKLANRAMNNITPAAVAKVFHNLLFIFNVPSTLPLSRAGDCVIIRHARAGGHPEVQILNKIGPACAGMTVLVLIATQSPGEGGAEFISAATSDR